MAHPAPDAQSRPFININGGYLKIGKEDCPDAYPIPIDRAKSFRVYERRGDSFVDIRVGTYRADCQALYQVEAMHDTDTLVHSLTIQKQLWTNPLNRLTLMLCILILL